MNQYMVRLLKGKEDAAFIVWERVVIAAAPQDALAQFEQYQDYRAIRSSRNVSAAIRKEMADGIYMILEAEAHVVPVDFIVSRHVEWARTTQHRELSRQEIEAYRQNLIEDGQELQEYERALEQNNAQRWKEYVKGATQSQEE